jgi:ABC-type multidrug transport system fused ATPase/permease subunit
LFMREYVSIARQGIRHLTQRGRRVLVMYFVSMVAIAGLDGIALFLLSKLLTPELTSGNSNPAADSNLKLLVMILALFVLRSALSTLVGWVSLSEFAQQEVEIGQRRMESLHEAPLETRLALNESDFFTAVDRAPTTLINGYLIPIVNICIELITGLVIIGVVLVFQPLTAIVALTYFALVAIVQHKFLSASQARTGRTIYKNGNVTYELLADYFHMNKLLQVNDSKSFDSTLRMQRTEFARARALQAFTTALPRYFMESSLALGFLVIAGATWLLLGEDEVVPALAIFAAAGFRMLPIVNRIQGLVLSAIGCIPLAREALIAVTARVKNDLHTSMNGPVDSQNALELIGVDFTYASGSAPVLEGINLSFKEGLQYAIVGPSGAGKTTLIDVCLGLLTPQRGEVLWNFKVLNDSFGYVPQDTHVSSASIAGNVALEWDSSAIDLNKVRQALSVAHLEEYFDSNLEDRRLTENFNRMSGGQRQRLGLARALYRDSKLLVLDEATSSLDAITESKVMDTVKLLRGNTTVIIVAHRLTTIKDADQVIYLEGGKVLGIGTFTDLQRTLPQFEEQVRLGLLTD